MPPVGRLIPGTALVVDEPQNASQGEGRGVLDNLEQGHVGPLLSSGPHDGLGDLPASERERAYMDLALRALANRGLRDERPSFEQIGVQVDANGRAVTELHAVPAGWESELTFVYVDTVSDANIHASAPYANANAFAFLAILGSGQQPAGPLTAASIQALRAGATWSWPNPPSTTGPIIPASAFWSDDNAPIVFGGEALFYCLQGSAGIASHQLVVNIGMRHKGPVAVG